ncbi:unnamed protein product, partial [Tenebrio molitor]
VGAYPILEYLALTDLATTLKLSYFTFFFQFITHPAVPAPLFTALSRWNGAFAQALSDGKRCRRTP